MSNRVTTEEAARRLNIAPRRVVALIQAGRLPAQRVGSGQRAIYVMEEADLQQVAHRPTGRPAKVKETRP
ncbi:MAG: excisionase family DNA-binding protein [Armatimonadetes bacterium]|nr:excisionase family DNA-binding protein [Armatimonadota bacterium]